MPHNTYAGRTVRTRATCTLYVHTNTPPQPNTVLSSSTVRLRQREQTLAPSFARHEALHPHQAQVAQQAKQ
eukprot:8248189-Heterocapsa_arctica.AAC.1